MVDVFAASTASFDPGTVLLSVLESALVRLPVLECELCHAFGSAAGEVPADESPHSKEIDANSMDLVVAPFAVVEAAAAHQASAYAVSLASLNLAEVGSEGDLESLGRRGFLEDVGDGGINGRIAVEAGIFLPAH